MTDLMDDRLAAAARRWQASQPPPPAVPLGHLDGRPGRSRRKAATAVVAAAAVAVLGLGGWLVRAGQDGGSVAPGGGGSPARSAPVPWVSLAARHPHVHVLRAAQILVAGDLNARVHAGQTLDFTVTLVTTEDLALDPCPDYSLWIGRSWRHRWQLNCAAVPYRDALGHHYLPGGTPVSFAMKVVVPDLPGRQKMLWLLHTRAHMLPGVYGVLVVR